MLFIWFSFTVSIEIPRDVTWIKINCHQKGYYRVNYDERSWNKFIELLKNDLTVSIMNSAYKYCMEEWWISNLRSYCLSYT
jgi:hypothetical protein